MTMDGRRAEGSLKMIRKCSEVVQRRTDTLASLSHYGWEGKGQNKKGQGSKKQVNHLGNTD